MEFCDGLEHDRTPFLVAKRFTPRVIEQMRDQMQDVVDKALDAAAPQGRNGRPLPILPSHSPDGHRADPRLLAAGPDGPVSEKRRSDYISYLTFETTLEQELSTHRSVLEAEAYFRDRIAERQRLSGRPDAAPG